MTRKLTGDDLLQKLAKPQSAQPITQLFADDDCRAGDFRSEAAGLVLDYSKHRMDRSARSALIQLAEKSELARDFDALTTGATVNVTEERAALHSLLRGTRAEALPKLWQEVRQVSAALQTVVSDIHSGTRCGFTGEAFTDVVNLGIGGSDFGPRMVCRALRGKQDLLTSHFVANVDPQDLDEKLARLDPKRTLFIICSKSFTTEETLTNAQRAKAWLRAAGAAQVEIAQHTLAVTTNIAAAGDFGVREADCFPIWDWVGGRYSLWSAAGMSIALQGGWTLFERLLAGAHRMDEHTLSATGVANLPLMMALLEFWNTFYLGSDTHLVLPYAQRLEHLPDFLQQLSMESNGKRVDLTGKPLSRPSAPVLWGSAGTIGQHSYYQLLHQGNRSFTADIVLPLSNGDVDKDAHRKLAANALAQSRALLTGRTPEEALALAQERGQSGTMAAHYEMPGNHSHSLIYFKSVTAESLGALIAAYEHKTFFLARLLRINAFDQWGVELGKVIGKKILTMLETGAGIGQLDDSTATAVRAWRAANNDS